MNRGAKIVIVLVLAAAVGGAIALKYSGSPPASQPVGKPLPRLIELGSTTCIPCKMMAPILDELRREYAGRLQVDFIDVHKDDAAAEKYDIRVIPTQVLLDAAGKELFRHEGFFPKADILAKWRELGVDLAAAPAPPPAPVAEFVRLDPPGPDTRPADDVCYLCDGKVGSRTRVTVKTDKGDVVLCSPHCYFIMLSSLLDARGVEDKARVTDWATGQPVPAVAGFYVCGLDESARPTVKAFAAEAAAMKERQAAGGCIVDWPTLRRKELAARCGFCDRAVYPEDSSPVRVCGVHTWGCCPMCALGVAARTGRDIDVRVKDALTGEEVRVQTLDGAVSSLTPPTAVAWAGKKRAAGGKVVSAGCFKQAFFTSEANLRTWVEQHPRATGKMVAIQDALAAKMKLTPQQISKACKIGECTPN